ncbi:NAD(P)/FAD-dependent oxidoreductase [Chitinophaga sp. NPDC101104]|uniref:NAD(P)/FAD-dependent oxidoreductase n=1 Tax=Chitinophaga sp. NPDC101104 TaxID=3390561 RepID=UPI003CFF3855
MVSNDNIQEYEVAIAGGSSAGLSAALTLGRTLRKTVVIDGGSPRNRFAAHAHNFFTRDNTPPSELLRIAREQLQPYETVDLVEGYITTASKTDGGFLLETRAGDRYFAKKIVLATGLKDDLDDIPGLEELWGNRVIHCPYCHGWEVRRLPVCVIANGEAAEHYAVTLSNWHSDITFLTQGESRISAEMTEKFVEKGYKLNTTPIKGLEKSGEGVKITLQNGDVLETGAVYYRPQKLLYHNSLAEQLGCEMSPDGVVTVSPMFETTVPGVFAAGDLTHAGLHQLYMSAMGGHLAGTNANRQLTQEAW